MIDLDELGSVILMRLSGTYYDLDEPIPSMIHIEDIAWGLSRIERFNGQCERFCSVAEHSVRVSYLVSREDAFWGLMHDAAEAYVGDMTSPLKSLLPTFKIYERKAERAIYLRYNDYFNRPEHSLMVKVADLKSLLMEARDNMGDPGWSYNGMSLPKQQCNFWSPIRAHLEFLRRFDQLTKGNGND